MSLPIIQVENVSKAYRLGQADVKHAMLREALLGVLKAPFRRLKRMRQPSVDEDLYWALRNVSLNVGQGEVVGIIGRNGAGKSTLLKILSRITEPTEGRVTLRGRVASLLEVGTGFHQELTGRENIYLNGAILGMTRGEINRKFDEIVAFAEIDQFLDTAVKYYSSGMYVRLAFAVAKMGEVTKMGRTVLFVSHNMAAVRSLCGTSCLLEKGRVLAFGPSHDVIDRYMAGQSSSAPSDVHFTRPGRASLWLTRACVLSDGKSSSTLAMGSALGIEIHFGAEPATMYPRIGFIITTSDGIRLIGASNRYQPSEPIPERTERGSIVCQLGRVPLMPGTHTVSLWLGDQNLDTHVELDCLTFTVLERDIWGLGKLPPSDTSIWWPTEFELRSTYDTVTSSVELGS
jgi:lipopolysaccharide transport system ATP-binding protein